jgi:hypothetical protein
MTCRILTPSRMLLCCCFLPITVLFSSCTTHKNLVRQKVEKTTGIDLDSFNRNLRIAEELVNDDKIAWKSTDAILAERVSLIDSLDSTWFVCRADNRRYAYYGHYAADEEMYYPKYVFASSDDSIIEKVAPEANPEATFFAKMVTAGISHFKTIVDSLQLEIHYNHYIRKAPGGRCIMWFFPAGYGNYCAQGIEVRIHIDSASGAVTGHDVDGALLHYFELDKKSEPVKLDNTWSDTPSIGNIFFVLSNRENFTDMKILNRNSISRLIRSPDDDTWTWEHTPK